MIKQIKRFFGSKTEKSSDLSDFFTSASTREKKKVFKKAMKAASRDQRHIVTQFERMSSEA